MFTVGTVVSVACTMLNYICYVASITIIPGIPLTVLGDSPVAAVDYSVMETVDHPTGGASPTPSRKAAKRRQAAGRSHGSTLFTYSKHMTNYILCCEKFNTIRGVARGCLFVPTE